MDEDNIQYEEEEKEEEEEEEFTTIYRKTKRTKSTKRRRRPGNVDKSVVKTEIKLNPFLVGAPVGDGYRPGAPVGSRPLDSVEKLVKDTLNEYKGSDLPKPRRERLFLGEFDSEDDDDTVQDGQVKEDITLTRGSQLEEEMVHLQNTRVWRCRKTGRNGLDRFRRVVEFVILAQQIFTTRRSVSLSRRDSILFFMDTEVNRRQSDGDVQQQFDVSEFKSLGQKTKTASVKTSLQVPPCDRTDGQINHMVHMLRGFTKFSNYPRTVQSGICKQGWYARFESSKVIVKEGSRAEFYYLILSGEAVYRDLGSSMEGIQSSRTNMAASYLRPGDTLGEKEILTSSERPATVVCKEPVEVLGIDRDTLLDIFKAAGGMASIGFLRTVSELTDFPLDLLQTYHFSMSAHYYRRGAVIVKNSNDSEWVYIVRSGSCQVYQAVKEESQKSRGTGGTNHNGYVPARSKGRLNLPLINQVKQETNRLKSASTNNIKDTANKKRGVPRKNVPGLERSQTMLPILNAGKTSLVQNPSQDYSPRINQSPRFPTLRKSLPAEDQSSQAFRRTRQSQKTFRKKSSEDSDVFRVGRANTMIGESDSPLHSRLGHAQSPSSESMIHLNMKKHGSNSSESDTTGNYSRELPRGSFESDVQNGVPSQDRRSGSLGSNDSADMAGSRFYIRLGMLTEKAVFGLHQLVYDNMPNLSLVSNGAECVLLSKQFLKDHMTQTILQRLRSKLPSYPNQDQLRCAVDDQVNWGHYRDKLVNDIMN